MPSTLEEKSKIKKRDQNLRYKKWYLTKNFR